MSDELAEAIKKVQREAAEDRAGRELVKNWGCKGPFIAWVVITIIATVIFLITGTPDGQSPIICGGVTSAAILGAVFLLLRKLNAMDN